MSFNLSKNQTFDLSKSSSSGPRKVFMGLGWEMAKPAARSGFMGKLLGAGAGPAPASIDLDASCLMFDAQGKLLDTVWFRQLQSRDGSIVHSGDNRTGEGDGDDEVIHVDLSRLPAATQTLVFVINSFMGQTFEKVESAMCRIVDEDTGAELARYNLSAKNAFTAQIMAKVYRNGAGWTVKALGVACNGRTYQDLLPVIAWPPTLTVARPADGIAVVALPAASELRRCASTSDVLP